MKITIIYNTVHAFATQRNATQRNATQRNAYHNYILNNNFKFYISQFIFFYKRIHAKSGQTPNSCSFLITKKNQKITSFCQKEDKAKARFQRTTPFRIRNSLVKILSQYLESPSLRGFAEAIYINWIATPSLRSARNDNSNYIYAFSCALKNKFEIISRNENYAFDYNKYFCRNGNNRIGKLIRHSPKASYGNEVLQKTEVISLVDCFISFAMTGTIYFLAMIMAESLFSVLGIILISAFYLIEKF